MTAMEAIMQKASDPKNWKKTHKKSYEIRYMYVDHNLVQSVIIY